MWSRGAWARGWPLGVAMVVGAVAHARDAPACGGLFCDVGAGQSVKQTGADVVFFVDGKSVEAHIRLQYAGDAQQLAWVLPVPVKPDAVEVGCVPMFATLLDVTSRRYEGAKVKACPTCDDLFPPYTGPDPFGGGGSAGAGAAAPVVVEKGTAGAFDYVVLQGGTADALLTWLNSNNFQLPPDALPILETYLAKGFSFVAVRLVNGSDADDVHPIVVRYAGDAPSVPVQIARVAAADDMKIRALFLDVAASARWVPTNYKHVVLNDLLIDPLSEGANYDAVLNQAFDAPMVDGHGFATESLGPMPHMFQFSSAMWDTKSLAGESALTIMNALQVQGFAGCGVPIGQGGSSGSGSGPPMGAKCWFISPLVRGLLRAYLPTPMGLAEDDFYTCVNCFPDKLDASKWNGPAFAADLETRVVLPAKHADAMLAEAKHLTRMVTSLSPAEMTEDPDFHRVIDPSTVNRTHGGTHYVGCSGGDDWFAPKGGAPNIALTESGVWPTWDATMPAVARVEAFAVGGSAPVTLVDNDAKITAALTAWNQQRNISMKTISPSCGGSGGAAAAAGKGGTAPQGGANHGGTSATAGASPTAGSSGGSAGSLAPSASSTRPEAEGGCSTSGSEAPLGLTAWLAALLLGRRRKADERERRTR